MSGTLCPSGENGVAPCNTEIVTSTAHISSVGICGNLQLQAIVMVAPLPRLVLLPPITAQVLSKVGQQGTWLLIPSEVREELSHSAQAV